ncbi:hypothetical protein N0V93_009648 [Gnomoniopsis smithogilvyi]|uniref:RRM domain-containing protein n=1 Tax=Gnomoniopsis smithogilvyi TaxID=1191159 RepID=A0A9W8YN74_9PEZI|nr:hypothetical protein N0V93_009648 [Gnomoniopsis smithogilvyi]
MAKSELKTEKKASKRKLSEVADEVDTSATAAPSKKAKKDKKDKSDKKSKKDKKDKKSRKEIKAEQADDLNHAEYDIEDKAIEEAEPVMVEIEEKKSKKEKKDKKSKKEKKAKVEEEEEVKVEEKPVNGEEDVASKKDKKDKKDKKAKTEEPKTNGGAAETVAEGEKKKKSKKDKKDKKSKKGKNANDIEIKDEDLKINNGEANGEGQSTKNNRFICFIGNLPFTATKADVEAHFSALAPSSVRLLTEKDNPTKSRGIAFIEFDHFSRMKTCLAKFHHTEFTDSAGNVRKINVELTAGGGGKKEGRMDKVKERNFKLNEERARRIAKEEEEKRNGGGKKAAEVKKEVVVDEREDAYVHPSRRAHVPGRRM